ncbi:MAG: cytochrome c [Sulfurimicrobium sp.]|nr:cytochrome c [Sulfurimicrobium sp.]
MKPVLILSLLILCSAPAAHAFSGMGNPDRGKMIFTQRCTMCHGEDGRGRDGMAADLVGEWHRLTKSDMELTHNLRTGALRTPGKIYSAGQCPPQMLNDRDMNDVLAYLRNSFGTPQLDFGR